MTLLHVDDELGTALIERYRRRFFSPGLRRWFCNVVVFRQAHRAVRWLRAGCWLNAAGEPVFESVRHGMKAKPDVAFVDIDFKAGTEHGKETTSAWGEAFPLKGMSSAWLGFAVAKAIQLESPECSTILCTAKGDVKMDPGLDLLRQPLTCDGLEIPPLLPFENKGPLPDLERRVLTEIAYKSLSKLHSGRFNYGQFIDFVKHFAVIRAHDEYEAIAFADIQETLPPCERPSGDRLKDWFMTRYGGFLSLFPSEFKTIADFSPGDTLAARQGAVNAVLEFAPVVDRNVSLLRMLKRINVGGKWAFLSPSAAIRHGHPWDYGGNGITYQTDKILRRRAPDGTIANKEELNDQKRQFAEWFAASLDTELKGRIAGDPFMWFSELDSTKDVLKEWESTFIDWTPELAQVRWRDEKTGHTMEVLVGELPCKKYLTDWRSLFGGRNSVFGQFLGECLEHGVESVLISGDEKEGKAELVFLITRGDRKHVWRAGGQKEANSHKRLRFWGRSWLEVSEPPTPGSSVAKVNTQAIWPLNEPGESHRTTFSDVPVYELHWVLDSVLN